MLQFVLADGAGTTHVAVCSVFPFSIGRDPAAHLQLSVPGVWDQHARVLREETSGKLVIETVGEALLFIDGARVERAFLFPGQQVQVGGATLGVSLVPVAQKNLRLSEGLLWMLVLLVVVLEAALLIVLR